ncbi:hypothetical protein ACW7BM_27600, partial [Klebsiella pneumoniae]
VCVVGKMRDLILQLSKSSIYSTKPFYDRKNNVCMDKKVTFSKKPRMYRRIKRITGEKRLSKSTLKSICFLWQSEMNETGRIL